MELAYLLIAGLGIYIAFAIDGVGRSTIDKIEISVSIEEKRIELRYMLFLAERFSKGEVPTAFCHHNIQYSWHSIEINGERRKCNYALLKEVMENNGDFNGALFIPADNNLINIAIAEMVQDRNFRGAHLAHEYLIKGMSSPPNTLSEANP